MVDLPSLGGPSKGPPSAASAPCHASPDGSSEAAEALRGSDERYQLANKFETSQVGIFQYPCIYLVVDFSTTHLKQYKYQSKWIMKPQIIGVNMKNVGVARTYSESIVSFAHLMWPSMCYGDAQTPKVRTCLHVANS